MTTQPPDARQIGIYRNRKSLSLFEAACLAHCEDPEESFNRAWYSIDPEIRAGATSPKESATLVEAMRGLLLGEVGQTWGALMKAFGVSGDTQQPIADIQDALSAMGMALPFEVKETSGGPSVGTPGPESDLSMGRAEREKRKAFARMNESQTAERTPEWARWKNEADKIQAARKSPASKRQLAKLVKESLQIPDSAETIRKHI